MRDNRREHPRTPAHSPAPGNAGRRQVFAGNFACEDAWGSRGRGFKSRRPDCFSNASWPGTAAVQQYPRKTLKVCMRPLSGRHAVGGFKITTLGRGGFASRVLRVVRHERGRHSRRASIADMPIQWASPPCSPWHRNPHLGGSSPAHSGTPAYVTDGDGRAGMRRARSAVLYRGQPWETGSVRGAQNGTFCRGLSSGGCASKFGGRPSKPERGNGHGKRAGSFLSGR